jgi:hypothetical protein
MARAPPLLPARHYLALANLERKRRNITASFWFASRPRQSPSSLRAEGSGTFEPTYMAIALPPGSPLKKSLDEALVGITGSQGWRQVEDGYFGVIRNLHDRFSLPATASRPIAPLSSPF